MARSSRHFNLGSFRMFYYGGKTSLVVFSVCGLLEILVALFPVAPALGTVLEIFFAASLLALMFFALQGAVVGLLWLFNEVRMRCPFCAAYGAVGGDKENGLYMDCDRCGIVHAPSWLGLKLVKAPTPSSITYSWQRDPSVPLVLDLDAHQLSGVGIGSSLQALSFLGPASNVDFWAFRFPEEGVEVEEDAEEPDRVYSIAICFRADEDKGIAVFPGRFRYRGNLLPLETLAYEENVVRAFGPPYWRNEDEDEVILFYEFGYVEWQVEVALDGETKALVVSTPALADPEQRRLYGVDKPWPPVSIDVAEAVRKA